MDPVAADYLIRSRATLLRILDDRGYDVTAYRHISTDQIMTLARGDSRALDMIVPRKASSSSSSSTSSSSSATTTTTTTESESETGIEAPCDRAVVIYAIQDRIRTKLETFPRDLFEKSPDAMGHNAVKTTDDILVIVNEPLNEVFDKTSLALWQTRKIRLTFFHIKQVVVHPGSNELVDPHRKLSAKEAAAILERFRTTTKTQLPLIKHDDLMAKVLGLIPGDIVEILRASPTSGIQKYYRICAA